MASNVIKAPFLLIMCYSVRFLSCGAGMPKDVPFFKDKYEAYRCGDMWGNTFIHKAVLDQDGTQLSAVISQYPAALDVRDLWSSSHSTPLILACKLGDQKAALALILAGANVDLVDFHGFSPLHYACLYRQTNIIDALLNKNANPLQQNDFELTAIDYYQRKIVRHDLEYRYGYHNGALRCVYDHRSAYTATYQKDLSALRWFIHVVVKNLSITGHKHPNARRPVWQKEAYQDFIAKFTELRNCNYQLEVHSSLVKHAAKLLQIEYQARLQQLFCGWIWRHDLKVKYAIAGAITAEQLKRPGAYINQQNGRTRTLLNHYLSFLEDKKALISIGCDYAVKATCSKSHF